MHVYDHGINECARILIQQRKETVKIMVLSAKQKQKKLQRKVKKRKQSLAKPPQTLSKTKASAYATSPIHECLIPEDLFETGLGNVTFARKAPSGGIALSAFVVDVFCLGVKNALFKVSNINDYEENFKLGLFESHAGRDFFVIDPMCARKLIEGAVAYAEALGFGPHSDYQNAKALFGDIDTRESPDVYVYGKDGKPFYIRGPNESPAMAKSIVSQLHERCGEDGYQYMVGLDEKL